MSTTRRMQVAVLAALVLVPAGCGGSDSGTAAPRAGARAQCVAADPQGELIVHPGSFTAPEAGQILRDVALDGASNLEVIEADAVRFRGRSTIQGVILDYPPRANANIADSLADWADRQPLEGLRVTAADGQQAVLVSLRLADPTRPGHLRGVELDYEQDGRELTRTMAQPVLVKPHGQTCMVSDYASASAWAS